MKSQINIRASELLQRQLAELTDKLGTSITETVSLAIDRMYQQEIKTMSNQLTAKYEIERSLGTVNTIEGAEVRFWITTNVNGRTVDSRGTVKEIWRHDTTEIRRQSRRVCEILTAMFAEKGWTAANGKEANATFATLLDQAMSQEDAEDFDTAINNL